MVYEDKRAEIEQERAAMEQQQAAIEQEHEQWRRRLPVSREAAKARRTSGAALSWFWKRLHRE